MHYFFDIQKKALSLHCNCNQNNIFYVAFKIIVMKRNLLNLTATLLLVAVYFIFVGFHSRTTNDDNQQEQAVIAEMNRCRMNPKGYAETVLKKHLDRFIDENTYRKADGTLIMTDEGRERVQEAISELKRMQPVEPLTYDEDLVKAASFHCEDTGPAGLVGHNSSDGTSMNDRLKRYVKDRMTRGENIDYGNSNAEDIVVSLVVDDGVPSCGHLKNIMKSTFRRAGAAIGPHKQYGFMCTIDFSD